MVKGAFGVPPCVRTKVVEQTAYLARVERFTFQIGLVDRFSPTSIADGMTIIYREFGPLLMQNGGLAGMVFGPIIEFSSSATLVDFVWTQ